MRFALIGHPVKASKSPWVHQTFGQSLGLNVDYRLIDLSETSLDRFFKEDIFSYDGVNVTAPFKEKMLDYVAGMTPLANLSRSINTLFWKKGALWGDTTDGQGLLMDIAQRIEISLEDKRILILGAGGAARSILCALGQVQSKEIVVFNRTQERAQCLIKETAFSNASLIESLEKMNECLQEVDVVFNTITPSQESAAFLVQLCLSEKTQLAYDLNYKKESVFLKAAQKAGIGRVENGMGMLIGQAALSFERWTGLKVNQPFTLMEGLKNDLI